MIRRGTTRDARAAADLWLRARKAALGAIPPPAHSDEEVQAWFETHVAKHLELWVAETDSGELHGILALDGEWIDQLYVDPAHTGRGIGSELVELAKRRRPAGLRLWTFESNERAQRFYERHGFAAVARTDGSENEEHSPDIQYAYRK